MKRGVVLFFCVLMLLAGCLNRKPTMMQGEYQEVIPTGPLVEEGSVPESELRTDLLRRAMLNDKKVNNSGSYRMLNEFQENIDGFYVADIDNDDINEVVLVDGEDYYSLDVVMDTVNYAEIWVLPDVLRLNKKGYWQYEKIEDGVLKYLLIVDKSHKSEIEFDMGTCTVDDEIVENNIKGLIMKYYSDWATYYEYTEDNIYNYVFSEAEYIKDSQFTLVGNDSIDNYDGELNLMQKVLLGIEEYYDTENNISKIATETFGYEYYRYMYLVDYNNDNKQEVVVALAGTLVIFYEINGQIYSFDWGYRNMSKIYKDGAFEYNPDVYYRITELTASGVTMEEVLDYTPAEEVTEYLFSKYEILNTVSHWK